MKGLDFDEIARSITPDQFAQAIGVRPASSSGSYHCSCPAHENGDNQASLSISRKNGRTLVNSFVCDVKGTPVQTAAKVWNVSLGDAAERLASAAGIMTTTATSSKGSGLGEEVVECLELEGFVDESNGEDEGRQEPKPVGVEAVDGVEERCVGEGEGDHGLCLVTIVPWGVSEGFGGWEVLVADESSSSVFSVRRPTRSRMARRLRTPASVV